MGNGRAKKSARNIAYRLTYQIISMILKFVSRSVFIYVLGVEYLGINGLFTEVLQMLSLADLGMSTAMVYSFYEPLAKGDEEHIAQLTALYRKIYYLIAAVITVIGVGLIPFLKYLVRLDRNIPHIYLYYLLYLANTVASYLVIYRTSVLTADQKNYVLSKYNALFDTACTLAGILLLLISRSFLLYLILQVLFTYLKNFYCSFAAGRMYPYINRKTKPLPDTEKTAIFGNIRSVFIYKLSSTLVTSTDNTLMSVMVGTAAVGYYSNYSMITANILLFINIIFTQVTSSIGNLIMEGDAAKNYKVFRTMQEVSFVLSSFGISCVFLLISDFIRVWLGRSFVFDRLILTAIVINMFFSVVLMPIWSYRDATGIYRQTKYVMLMTAFVNLVLSVILGLFLGIAGILFATSISRLTTYFWYEPKLLFRQYFGRGVRDYYLHIGQNILITCLVSVILWVIFRRLTPEGWVALILKMAAVAASSAVLTLLFYSRSEVLSDLFRSVKKMLKRKGRTG